MVGLPDGVRALLFDLDGVLTPTAKLHAAAWKRLFEEAGYGPFTDADYNEYVDGKPRYDGVRDFLAARGVHPSEDEVRALGDRKQGFVEAVLAEQGVEPYPGSVAYLRAARDAGLKTACVTSSANGAAVLEAAGIADCIDVRIDGVVAQREHLRGKPAPDTFLAGAKALGATPEEAAVFEDALAGVEAARAGGFRCVVGVDRVGHRAALKAGGADIVVDDLAELLE